MSRRPGLSVLVAVLSITAAARAQEPPPAAQPAQPQEPAQPAQPEQVELEDSAARGLYQVALAHYEQGRFLDAAHEFEEAHRLSGRIALLYNAYLAYRDANRRAEAARTLRAFLEGSPDAPDRTMLEARLAALDEEIRQAGTATTTGTGNGSGASTTANGGTATSMGTGGRDSSHRDAPPPREQRSLLVPIVLLSAGGALLVGAGVAGAVVLGWHGDLEEQCTGGICDRSLESKVHNLDTLSIVADGLGLAGIVAAGIGVVLLLVGGDDDGERDPSAPAAAAGCTPDGCGLSLGWRL